MFNAIQLTAGVLAVEPALNILQVKPVVEVLVTAAVMLPIAPAVDVETTPQTTIGVPLIAFGNVTETSVYELAETEVVAIVPACICGVWILPSQSTVKALERASSAVPLPIING
jgi:hypothetical protein